jgi:hypothetical protein
MPAALSYMIGAELSMSKFKKYNLAEMLGFTRLADVQDHEIWEHLLTPQVKALIGPITRRGEPQVMETIEGQFPGDVATNLNLHRLYAGSADCVRFPYISTLHKTENGALVIKRDTLKVKVMAWVGDVMSGRAELVFIASLRDRRYDGTKRANDSALLFYTYDDPKYHRRLHEGLRSAEVSIYSFLPGSRVVDATGEPEFEQFIEKPFTFLDRPELFVKYFQRAWLTSRAPGQFAAAIQDVSKKILPGFEAIARSKGYDLLECATSHYHVAWWFKSRGYRYSYVEDEQTMQQLADGIKRIKESGHKLTRPQESWVCVIQSLRPTELIPTGLYLNGPLWPQDNIGPELLWMNKPLTDKATALIPSALQFESTNQ